MIGAIIGDIAGSVYEFNNIKTKDFPLFSEKGFFTDDTIMTIAVAEALLNGGTADDFIDSMKKFGRLYPNADYGGNLGAWLLSDDREPYNSWGNGSAMRVSPCAWWVNSLEEVEELAKRSAAVTHNHPEGIKGAQATAAAIYLARMKKPRKEIKSYIENKYGYDLSRTLDEIRPVYEFNESCQETVPEAIIAFLESKSFEDAIRNAISLGGDSDTLAAITGSIAEAYYKINSHTLTKVFGYIDDTLAAVINNWLDKGKSLGAVAERSDLKHYVRLAKRHYRNYFRGYCARLKKFSKPHSTKMDFPISEAQYARIRCGSSPCYYYDNVPQSIGTQYARIRCSFSLCYYYDYDVPWLAYFKGKSIHFYCNRTGEKIYEVEIKNEGSQYVISKIIVETNAKIHSGKFDLEEIILFRKSKERDFHFI